MSRAAPTTSPRRRNTSWRKTAVSRFCCTAHPPARCVPGCSRSAIRERVQRLALDALVWTGEGSPTLAERKKRLAQYQAEQPAADRSRVRAQHLHARPSRHERSDGRRRIRRCRARARHIDAERDLHRHVGQPAGARSEEDHRADADHARRSTTASPRSRTSPTSSRCCPTPTSSSSSCPGSRIPARARRTGRSSITCSTASSANRPRSTSAENSTRDRNRGRAVASARWLERAAAIGYDRRVPVGRGLLADSPLARRPRRPSSAPGLG